MIHVAVGVVFNKDAEILIAQRPMHKYKGGLWEFPGGKLESGENAFEALQREFLEEVGITILTATEWLKIQYEYDDRHVLLDTWIVKDFTGQPIGREGQAVRWVKASDLADYEFPQGNKLIIEKLLKSEM